MLVEIQCDKFKTGGKDGEVRLPIRFHAGLNAVVGDDDRSNSIGKSTLLMIIDYAFGGDDYIKKCSDIHSAIKEHVINFTFRFGDVEYSFARNTADYMYVIPCDRPSGCRSERSIWCISTPTTILTQENLLLPKPTSSPLRGWTLGA